MIRKILPLVGSIAVIGANSFALSPIARSVATSFPGVNAGGVMQGATVYGLATAGSALFLASAIDKIGPEAALERAPFALTAALAMSALAWNLWVFCAAQALAGVAAGCAIPAIYALSGRIAEKGRESETLGLVLTGWTVSLVVGVSMSALVADFVSWRIVFVGLGVSASLLAIVVRRGASLGLHAPTAVASTPLSALQVPGISSALLTVAFYMTAFYGLYAYLGPHFTGVLRLSTAWAGLAPAAYGLGFGIAAFLDSLLDRYGPAASTRVAYLGLGFIYCALAAAAALAPALIVLSLAWGVANHVGLNLIVGRLTTLDSEQQGAILALYSAVTYLAVSAGAFFYRPLFEQFGFAGWAFSSACCIEAALGLSLIPARSGSRALAWKKGDDRAI